MNFKLPDAKFWISRTTPKGFSMTCSKMKFVLLALLTAFLPKVILACDCAGSESFCKNAQPDDYCVMVKVGEAVASGFFEFEIIENIINEIDADKIILQSSTGWNCNASLSNFVANDTMIFNLWDASAFGVQPNNIDYVLTFCGTQYLSYANGMVTGSIDYEVAEMDYESFKTYIGNCSAPEEVEVLIEETTLFPNPTDGRLTIQSPEEIFAVEVFDMTGKKYLPNFEKFTVTSTTIVDLSNLPRGVYYLRIYGLNSEETFKVMKG